jgi:hypothetical protein
MTCHQCLIKWVEGGSLYDPINGGRYYISEVSEDGTEWSSRPSIAETVLNGEALCMFHLKAVWADILFALKKEEWNQYD